MSCNPRKLPFGGGLVPSRVEFMHETTPGGDKPWDKPRPYRTSRQDSRVPPPSRT